MSNPPSAVHGIVRSSFVAAAFSGGRLLFRLAVQPGAFSRSSPDAIAHPLKFLISNLQLQFRLSRKRSAALYSLKARLNSNTPR